MLRITKLTDYAIVVLSTMIGRDGNPASAAARDVAGRSHVPQPTVSKVLKLLARAGLVVSERGKHGGYRLAHNPSEITVAQIIDAVEGPIAVTECSVHSPGGCELEGRCPMEENWIRINVAISKALGDITLSDMTRPLPLPSPLVPLRRTAPLAEA
jgi:FeS assembly SUF system regulator